MRRSPDEDSTDTVPCPYCGAPVYEDAERCPACENYLSEEDAPSRKPRWILWTAIVCLVVARGWAVGC
jgi:predicted nucleic acid-binding Zn ribbon protein